MKRKKKQTPARKYVVIAVITVGICLIATTSCIVYVRSQNLKTPDGGPLSRQIMAFAEQEVIAYRVPPPLAALQYAYIASAYADSLQRGGQTDALYAAKEMFIMLYPDSSNKIAAGFGTLAALNRVQNLQNNSSVSGPVLSVIHAYINRYASDGHTLAWNGVIPKGPDKWVSRTGLPPVSPRAGDWKRWTVTTPISVPPPPAPGSAADNIQLHIVAQAVAARNGEDSKLINFWAGSIGTETPSGIWQNQLFATVKNKLSTDAVSADNSYALIQKNVAQTMSDAFMECWKVKYIYWTARPDMRLPGLVTGMPDPNFPGYISGHSTVSKAAADVLSVMDPADRTQWEAMAAQARRSRLVAGIHFDVDNSVGFDVGTNVASQSVTALHITRVL